MAASRYIGQQVGGKRWTKSARTQTQPQWERSSKGGIGDVGPFSLVECPTRGPPSEARIQGKGGDDGSFIKTRHLAQLLRKVHPPVRTTGPRFVAWYLKTGDPHAVGDLARSLARRTPETPTLLPSIASCALGTVLYCLPLLPELLESLSGPLLLVRSVLPIGRSILARSRLTSIQVVLKAHTNVALCM